MTAMSGADMDHAFPRSLAARGSEPWPRIADRDNLGIGPRILSTAVTDITASAGYFGLASRVVREGDAEPHCRAAHGDRRRKSGTARTMRTVPSDVLSAQAPTFDERRGTDLEHRPATQIRTVSLHSSAVLGIATPVTAHCCERTTFDDGHLVCPCVTDHALSQCPTAAPRPSIPAAAGEDILLRWHGPTAHRAISLWAGDGHQEEMIEEVSAVRRISTWRSAPSRVVFEGEPGTQNENAIEGDVYATLRVQGEASGGLSSTLIRLG